MSKKITALEAKELYKGKEYNGYKWFGFIDNRHHFQKETEITTPWGHAPQYMALVCTDKQLHNGDFEYMADHGLTYTK